MWEIASRQDSTAALSAVLGNVSMLLIKSLGLDIIANKLIVKIYSNVTYNQDFLLG